MSEENLNPQEEVDTKPAEGSESEDALEELFKSDDDSQDELEDSEKVKKLEERLGNIEKGVKKYFSEQGRKQKEEPKKQEKREEASAIPQTNSVLKTLYFDKFPETKEVWEEVMREAKLLGKDPFELYESSSYFKGEAKARYNAKKEDDENKSKIAKPSSGTASSKIELSSVKPEDVANLKPSQKMDWISMQAEKERNSID
jgi:chemotaxis protein histidine kinase CheA